MKKSGINKPLVCKHCGHKVGYVKLKTRFKWKLFWQGMVLALILEFVANLIVYLLFR